MLIKVTTMNLWGTPPPAGIFASKSRAVSTMCRSVAGSVKPEAKRVLENKIANCKLHPVQHFYFGKKKNLHFRHPSTCADGLDGLTVLDPVLVEAVQKSVEAEKRPGEVTLGIQKMLGACGNAIACRCTSSCSSNMASSMRR